MAVSTCVEKHQQQILESMLTFMFLLYSRNSEIISPSKLNKASEAIARDFLLLERESSEDNWGIYVGFWSIPGLGKVGIQGYFEKEGIK